MKTTPLAQAAVSGPAASPDDLGSPPAAVASFRETAHLAGSRAPGRGTARRRRAFVVSAVGGLAEIVAVAYAFPLVILAVGIPLALLARLMMWIVGAI